jgi:hypothetical protein
VLVNTPTIPVLKFATGEEVHLIVNQHLVYALRIIIKMEACVNLNLITQQRLLLVIVEVCQPEF